MTIDKIRIYVGVYEQGLDLAEYVRRSFNNKKNVEIVYTGNGNLDDYCDSSLVSQIKRFKDFDALLTIISDNKEYPFTMIEYSTAFPTDDHTLQRFDCIFWSGMYNIVSIKISPTNFSNKYNGGGTKITTEDEMIAAKRLGVVYYHVNWEIIKGTNYVKVKNDRVSCPIYLQEFQNRLNFLFHMLLSYNTYIEYYEHLFSNYSSDVPTLESIKEKFSNSTRYTFDAKKDTLRLKFNRFGHGLDPEKGMLVFWSTLMDQKVDIEFVVQRNSINGRSGYFSLCDGTSAENKLMDSIKENYIKSGNEIGINFALKILELGLGWQTLLKDSRMIGTKTKIDDKVLQSFLQNANITSILLLYFARKIVLTNSKRQIITEVEWNNSIVKRMFKKIDVEKANKKILPLKQIQSPNDIEDWITYASQLLFRHCGFKIISASYPGAQSDRCVLSGNGRKISRDYIDLIAVSEQDKRIKLILQENKSFLNKSSGDIKKLNEFVRNVEKMGKLKGILEISGVQNIYDFTNYIGIGGQSQGDEKFSDIDYMICFKINRKEISYSIAIVNLSLIEVFKNIVNHENKLSGLLILNDEISVVS